MKTFFSILLCGLLLAACNNKTNEPVKDPAADNQKVITRLFEHFNKHEWEKMAALYIDSAEFKDPAYGLKTVKQSRKFIADHYQQLNTFMPDISVTNVLLYPSGDKHVVAEFVSVGTSGSMKIELPICTIFTIDNGMITKDYTYYDMVGAPVSQ